MFVVPALQRSMLNRARCVRGPVLVLLLTTIWGWDQQTSQPAAAQKPDGGQTSGKGETAKQRSAESTDNLNAASADAHPPDVLLQLNRALEDLAAKVSSAVVQIQTTGYGPLNDNDRSETALIGRQHAVGSGVIVDSDGYIMTNAHVVEGAQRIRVALPLPPAESRFNGVVGKRQVVEAKLLGIHKETDLALLKIDLANLPTLALQESQTPHVGELVIAVGSPQSLQNSVTMGVISAVARQADPTKAMNYIQTDAPINPGNSGGPLVDMNGNVVGINTFILTQSGGSEGLGFAIPARVVNFVYHSLRRYGHVHRIEIGAGAEEITPTLAEGLGLAQSWGVIVDDVVPDGPAAAAGLKVQDIVLAADDRRIETMAALNAATYLHPLDRVLKLEILRGTEKKTLYIPAIEKRDPMDLLMDTANPEKSLLARLGILVVDLTDQIRSMVGALRVHDGVVVVGRAANLIVSDSGLQTGDIIHSLNTKPVDSVENLRSMVRDLKPGAAVVLQIERAGGLQYLAFEME
jgi:serine protease Do